MISTPFHIGWPKRFKIPAKAFSLSLLAITLAACESVEDLNPFVESLTYACPEALILSDAATITVYRDGSPKDLLDVVYRSRFEIEDYECEWNLDPETGAGALTMSFRAMADTFRGPGLRDRNLTIPYFVTITDPERQVITKSQFDVVANLPPNAQRLQIRDRRVKIDLPIQPGQRDTDFVLFTGFQLTPDQLDFNRAERQKQIQRPR